MKSAALRVEAHGIHDNNGLLEMKMCKRKKGYPLRSQAERDLLAMSRETGEDFNIYACEFCGKLHIGHKSKPVFEFAKSDLFTDTLNIGDECLVNIRSDAEFYVFKIPRALAGASATEIVEEGDLVAFKEAQAPYFEKSGIRSRKWQVFTAMTYRLIQNFHGCQDLLESKRQNMVSLDCILVMQRDTAPFHTVLLKPITVPDQEAAAVQAPPVEQEQNAALEETILPSVHGQEPLLEKLRRLAAPDSGMTGEFFRGYAFALLEQEFGEGDSAQAVA